MEQEQEDGGALKNLVASHGGRNQKRTLTESLGLESQFSGEETREARNM